MSKALYDTTWMIKYNTNRLHEIKSYDMTTLRGLLWVVIIIFLQVVDAYASRLFAFKHTNKSGHTAIRFHRFHCIVMRGNDGSSLWSSVNYVMLRRVNVSYSNHCKIAAEVRAYLRHDVYLTLRVNERQFLNAFKIFWCYNNMSVNLKKCNSILRCQ